MKLTGKQIEVLVLMKNGWQLGLSKCTDGRWWLQKGGCCKGGETQDVTRAVAGRLRNEKMIVSDGYAYPSETFSLTEAGKVIVANQSLKERKKRNR